MNYPQPNMQPPMQPQVAMQPQPQAQQVAMQPQGQPGMAMPVAPAGLEPYDNVMSQAVIQANDKIAEANAIAQQAMNGVQNPQQQPGLPNNMQADPNMQAMQPPQNMPQQIQQQMQQNALQQQGFQPQTHPNLQPQVPGQMPQQPQQPVIRVQGPDGSVIETTADQLRQAQQTGQMPQGQQMQMPGQMPQQVPGQMQMPGQMPQQPPQIDLSKQVDHTAIKRKFDDSLQAQGAQNDHAQQMQLQQQISKLDSDIAQAHAQQQSIMQQAQSADLEPMQAQSLMMQASMKSAAITQAQNQRMALAANIDAMSNSVARKSSTALLDAAKDIRPEWGTQAGLEQSYQVASSHYGFAMQDLTDVRDPRLLGVINDALRYREIVGGAGNILSQTAQTNPQALVMGGMPQAGGVPGYQPQQPYNNGQVSMNPVQQPGVIPAVNPAIQGMSPDDAANAVAAQLGALF